VKRALLYARVSTADKGQDWHAQLEELHQVAEQRGWRIVGEFHDVMSGAKEERPGLGAAVQMCRRGVVDIFAAVSVDRVARSVLNLLKFASEIDALGVRLACTREGDMDTTTPQGAAFLRMRGIFAELERKFRAQQIREALAVRRARGVVLGRPRAIDYRLLDQAREMRATDPPASWSAIARAFGGTPGAWSRALSRAV